MLYITSHCFFCGKDFDLTSCPLTANAFINELCTTKWDRIGAIVNPNISRKLFPKIKVIFLNTFFTRILHSRNLSLLRMANACTHTAVYWY